MGERAGDTVRGTCTGLDEQLLLFFEYTYVRIYVCTYIYICLYVYYTYIYIYIICIHVCGPGLRSIQLVGLALGVLLVRASLRNTSYATVRP